MRHEVTAPKEIASVSVVIPCYRCSDTIERAVKAVAEQTLKPFEVILVEDCSGDNTLEALYQLQSQYEKEWIKVIALKENSGPGTARNIGWDTSEQDYIAFLDADDSWHPKKIEIQYSWMISHPDSILSGHGLISKSDSPNHRHPFKVKSVSQVTKLSLLLSNRFITSSVMLKKKITQRFPSGKRYCEDYFLWANLVFDGHSCFRLDLPLVIQYKPVYGYSGLSGDLWAMEKGELNVYKNLYKTNKLNRFVFLLFKVLSLFKFLKRFTFKVISKILRTD